MLLVFVCGGAAGGEPGVDSTLRIGGLHVAPGSRARFSLDVIETYGGARVQSLVHVLHGPHPGPVMCLTGGVHGDEISGVEIVRRVQARVDLSTLRGSVVAVPVVNVPAFRRTSRYLPDRRDLNRAFPGSPGGSMAARIAHGLMQDVIRHCTLLVDVHSGSDRRANLPQVRADMRDSGSAALARALHPLIVLHSVAGPATLRAAAQNRGVLAVTIEVGEAGRLDQAGIDAVVERIGAMLVRGPMETSSCRDATAGPPALASAAANCAGALYFRASAWVRAASGGIFVASVGLGERVSAGQALGSVIDLANDEQRPVRAQQSGLAIGRAVDQVVMPGFALFHIATDETPFAVAP